jgi:alginate O-acetyltransferase complex protein AlgI
VALTDPTFIFLFLPALFALYFPLRGIEGVAGTGAARTRASLVVLLGADLAFLGAALIPEHRAWWTTSLGAAMIACHAIAYWADVRRGHAERGRPLDVALYLLQFPVLAAGPIVRYRDFSGQLAGALVSLGAFAYGMRRLVIGVVKIALVAGPLGRAADAIVATRAPRPGLAWLGAVCAVLHVYYLFGGSADIAIGLGRMLGFRYPENFRRPFTAGTVREFWRRWNITLLTWLRDYLQLPIAGQDRPTPKLYVRIVIGFALVGWWHGAGWNAVIFGIYFGTLLGLEAVGLGARIERLPALARHAYVLVAVAIGGVIVHARTANAAGRYLLSMTGLGTRTTAAPPEVTPLLAAVLIVAAIGAGPLIPAISRWRVSLDAAVTSMLMMLAATGLFVWRPVAVVARSLWRSE